VKPKTQNGLLLLLIQDPGGF